MVRRSNTSAYNYGFHKSGAFGVFKSNDTLPVEFLMTSFTLDDLTNLSYARDINTKLNFDYLIQRDIDEERARDEISQYLAAGQGRLQKEIVFLPPILVAVVKVDEQDSLVDYYPACDLTKTSDDSGDIYVREWPGLFKIENYPLSNGNNFEFNCGDTDFQYKIDYEQAKLKVNITRKTVSGGRLVVIDGQHRLCALNYLKSNYRDAVEGISIPVCIVYSPLSCENKSEDPSIPNIAEVLRNLFVDVNATVERVSGHFLTLLSDQTLGSIICRELCKKSLQEAGELGLGLIEWNTKKHKESLEISREHTITSIGVINNALDECFKTKSGIRLISEIISLNKGDYNFDFGVDEYEDAIPLPEYFPWRDFLSRHKKHLTELINDSITPAIYTLFFGDNSIYKNYMTEFSQYFKVKKERFRDDRSIDAGIFESVKNHILLNDPLEKSSHSMLNEVLVDIKALREKFLTDFSRKGIFQKALLECWAIICGKYIVKKISLVNIPLYLNELVKSCFTPENNIFDNRHMYLQDTIFNGQKIKVTKVAKRQIIRLILAQAATPKIINKLEKDYNIDPKELSVLNEIAKVEAGNYIQLMVSDKKKTFEKSYKTNYSIDAFERDELYEAELKRTDEIKSSSNSGAISSFDRLVAKHTFDDIKSSFEGLIDVLGYTDISYNFEYEIEDEL
ncbi:hypothetical protein WH292_15885 [Enterobacter sp. MYb186]